MVGDLVQQVVRKEKKMRIATGKVDGIKLKLVKNRWRRNPDKQNWEVKVIATERGRTEQDCALTHSTAEKRFEYLLEKYDLTEDDTLNQNNDGNR